MSTIHSIVSRSAGSYTHDDVFELESKVVHHLSLMFYEQDAYADRLTEARKELNQNTA